MLDKYLNKVIKNTGLIVSYFCSEAKLYKWLQENYSNIERQVKFNWCKKKVFDFKLNNIIIELDGAQHFIQVSNWQSSKETQENDMYKMKKAIENGFSVIRLLQDDVYNDKNDWNILLKEHIEKIMNKEIIYICNDKSYDSYKIISNKIKK